MCMCRHRVVTIARPTAHLQQRVLYDDASTVPHWSSAATAQRHVTGQRAAVQRAGGGAGRAAARARRLHAALLAAAAQGATTHG